MANDTASDTASDRRDDAFDEHRRVLFGIAYRMLGSAADAEDIVQEAYLKWRQAPREAVVSPRAYLTTVVTRLAIDHLRSARVRREQYVGPWLPEPVFDTARPDEPAALFESLSMAFLVLLERLSPAERAALVLREAFDYEYGEIAEVLGKTEANCRQLVRRARERVAEHRPRFAASAEARDRFAERFRTACATGDMQGLLSALTTDVTLYSDGGGKVSAATVPVYGAERVGKFLLGLLKKAPATFAARTAEVNGQPGLVLTVDGEVSSVLALQIGPDGVEAIYIVRNPDKLGGVPDA
jgi:RNA polymerase sigma-70 factor, ECF subfamily